MIEEKDKEWLMVLVRELQSALDKRNAFINYLYHRYDVDGKKKTFSFEEMDFIERQENGK